jgi:hypothetical protein
MPLLDRQNGLDVSRTGVDDLQLSGKFGHRDVRDEREHTFESTLASWPPFDIVVAQHCRISSGLESMA